jgi:hypothetical protein
VTSLAERLERAEPEFIDVAVMWLDVIAAIVGLSGLEARVRSRPPTSRFRTIQVYPKDLRLLPGQP